MKSLGIFILSATAAVQLVSASALSNKSVAILPKAPHVNLVLKAPEKAVKDARIFNCPYICVSPKADVQVSQSIWGYIKHKLGLPVSEA